MGGPATARARPRSALPGLLREAGAARTVVSRPQKKTHDAKDLMDAKMEILNAVSLLSSFAQLECFY